MIESHKIMVTRFTFFASIAPQLLLLTQIQNKRQPYIKGY